MERQPLQGFRRAMRRAVLPVGLVMALATVPTGVSASETLTQAGRSLIVHVPSRLPPGGARALVIVLHGGLGNARRIAGPGARHALNMDDEADRDGFIVAYLNGTPVTRFPAAEALGWNAGGGCCGLSARNGVDDVAYITGAVRDLEARYGVDPHRVFAVGHSNGAMMAQRMVCETRVLSAVVAVSGPLNLPDAVCPGADGARILALHGAEDENVPLAGGEGSKGLSHVRFQSEESARRRLVASGASYTLTVIPGADHDLDHIESALVAAVGDTLSRRAARFFGLVP